MTQVAIVADGRGPRLRALTGGLPKILTPIAGRPFLSYVLGLLRRQGVDQVHLCLGRGAEQVLTYLWDVPPAGLDITVSVEPRPLGTGGALRLALPHLSETFVTLPGDTFTPVDLHRILRDFDECGLDAALAVLDNQDPLVPGDVRVADGRVSGYVKDGVAGPFSHLDHRHLDYGITVLRRSVLQDFSAPAGFGLNTLLSSLIRRRELAAIEIPEPERSYEIGRAAGYAAFEHLVRTTKGAPWPLVSSH